MINYIDYFREVFRLSPILIVNLPIFFAGINQDKEWLYFGAGAFLTEYSNFFKKKLVLKYFSKYQSIYRPDGAVQCSLVPQCNVTKPWSNLGMPSGHSQIVGYLAGYLIYRAISQQKHKNKPIKQILWEEKYLVITCTIIVLMGMIGRLNKNIGGFMSADPNGCHTIEQTIVGALIGIFYGVIFSKIYQKLFKKSK